MKKEKSKEHKKARKSADTGETGAAEAKKEEKTAEEPLQAQLVRLQADFDNFRKRTVRERTEWYQRANEDILLEILPVLDHFEMGLETARDHKTDKAVLDGFKLVYDQLMGTLKKFGLEPVDAAGEKFDPHLHEAMTHLPSAEHAEDVVMAQTRRGFMLGDKLLRPAQVVVSSGPPQDENMEASE